MATTAPPATGGPWTLCAAHLEYGKFYLGEPMILPTCILAAIIGVYFFFKIRALKSFAGASFVHCFFAYDFLHPPAPMHAIVFGVLDVGLTSCVGLSWSFNGLVDVGLVREGWRLYSVMAVSFIGLIAAWAKVMITVGGPKPIVFVGLYFGPILLSAVIYSLCQLWRFFRGETQGWYWFLGAEITAFVGVCCASDPKIAEYFCTYLGPNLSPWFNADFWWFILRHFSDASMYCYARFYLARTTEKAADQRGYSFHLQPVA